MIDEGIAEEKEEGWIVFTLGVICLSNNNEY